MAASPVFETPAPDGYVSQETKSRYMLIVSISAGVVFLAQQFLPTIVWVVAMPGMMFGGLDMRLAHVQRCAFWQGQLWFPEEHIEGPGMQRPRLLSINPAAEDPPDEQLGKGRELSMDLPWLLPADDRLWLIAPGTVGYLKAPDSREIVILKPRKRLENMSPPFWYHGRPAVAESSPDGYHLWTLQDGEWEHGGVLDLKGMGRQGPSAQSPPRPPTPPAAQGLGMSRRNDVQLVSSDGAVHVFFRLGGTIFYREGLPFDKETGTDQAQDESWETVAQAGRDWTAVALAGRPALFTATGDPTPSRIVGWKRDEGEWHQFFNHGKVLIEQMGVCSGDDPGRFAVLVQGAPGSVRLLEVQRGEVVRARRFGGGFPFFFSGNMVSVIGAMIVLPYVMTFVFAAVLSSLMRRDRIGVYATADARVPFASLWRRAVAELVDVLFYLIPTVPLLVWMVGHLENFEEWFVDEQAFFRDLGVLFTWLAADFACGFVLFLALSFMEGKWGYTPGKWVMRIKVVGIDLKPCGFGWALVRNLLVIVDGFFSYLVGAVLIAFTPKWQRLGDLAAGTVVIRSAAPFEEEPGAQPAWEESRGDHGAKDYEEPPPT